MSELANFTNALFGAANTAAKVDNDIISKQAKLSTQNKQIQMQADINAKLSDLRQRSDYMNWNDEMTSFFEQMKSEMSNPKSKYYCQNNLQGEMFDAILEQNRLGVTEKVRQMVQQREMERDIVDVQNSKTLLSQVYSGQQYIDMANELDKGLYESGRITLQQYDQQKDLNFKHGYETMYLNTFNASLDDALAAGKSFEKFYADIEKAMPEMKATDTYGLEKAYDKTALNAAIKKTCQQNYYAKLDDIQKGNAAKLSEIVQSMRQQNSEEGKVSLARRGQMAMNGMLGLKLSENDRLQYSAIFELALGGGLKGKASGTGSGAKKSDYDKFEDIIKANADTAVQILIDYPDLTGYEAAQIVSDNTVNEWFTADYQENYDKDYEEREKTFETVYKGVTSKESITNALVKRLIAKYPEVQALAGTDGKFTKLVDDMQKNPKNYGAATASDLANFLIDTVMESNANTTGEEIMQKFNKHINDCYIESCKYLEINKKGELEKTYDATKVKDIASAAKLLHEKDMVYTYNGEEYWAGQSKEALEKEGGLVDVMKNAVAGTLGIDDVSTLDFYYQRSKDDMTNVPIITYNGQSYEVNATEDGKGFTVTNLTTGEVMEGVIPDKKGERKQTKIIAKKIVKNASENTATLNKERNEEVENSIAEANDVPKAIQGANKLESEDLWTKVTPEERKKQLNIAINQIDKDAKKIENQKDSKKKTKLREEFEEKYGIKYVDWGIQNNEEYRYSLILNSK